MERDYFKVATITDLSVPLKVFNETILDRFSDLPQLVAAGFCSNNGYFIEMQNAHFQGDGTFCYQFFPLTKSNIMQWSRQSDKTTIFRHLPHIIQELSNCLERIHSNHIVHGLLIPPRIRYCENSKEVQVCSFPNFLRPNLCHQAGICYVFESPESIWFSEIIPANDIWSLGIIIICLIMQDHPKLQNYTNNQTFLNIAKFCRRFMPDLLDLTMVYILLLILHLLVADSSYSNFIHNLGFHMTICRCLTK